jgi:hypothetical protein
LAGERVFARFFDAERVFLAEESFERDFDLPLRAIGVFERRREDFERARDFGRFFLATDLPRGDFARACPFDLFLPSKPATKSS